MQFVEKFTKIIREADFATRVEDLRKWELKIIAFFLYFVDSPEESLFNWKSLYKHN